MHVLNKISLGDVCGHTDDAIVVVRYNTSSSQTQGQEPWQCDNKNIRVYDIKIVGEDTQESRQRRALGGLDFYHLIADTSGGTVYETTKSNIAAVVDIIKESVTTKPPLTILKFKLLTSSNNSFEIPVDNLIQNLTIKVQGSTSSVPTMHLYRPSGTQETFSNASVSKQQILGTKLRVIHIYNPAPGIWRMERVSTSLIDVDVTGSTDLQFSYQFMQPGPGGYGDYPLIGRPIAGENMTIQVSVPLVDKVGSIDSLLLVDRNGKVVANSTLRNVGGRRGKSLFKTHVVIPAKEFEIALEGKDKAGNVFRRLDPKIITALAIQLEVLPSNGTLYLKQSITIPYRVKNVGAGTATITVSITDDKGFAQSPTSNTYTVSSMASNNGSFTLKAGSIKGETTTVTISAKASGSSNNKVQYNVQRITVEEKIIRVIDTKAPTCNITSMTGKCDFGADICQCSKQTWEMKANVGDDGDGLLSVFSSGAGPKSTFKNDSFSIGHKLSSGVIHTTLSADCCHQQAKITVVDLAGNVGLCDVNITAGFVAPDPKLCIHPNNAKPVTTNANVTTISCNITNIVDTCNGNASGNRKPCENTFWSAEAQLGNEGFGRIQVAAVNAGRHANLTKLNHTVKLSTDCCHPDVYINVVDVAGNTGQCHTQITASTNKPGTGASSAASKAPPIGIIAGAAAGGVVVLSAVAGLVYYLKTRAGKIGPDTNAVTPLS
ncbi:uncharacterized protein LOC132718984 [Ruditapes philippinarum]|uniref:uncharacterized protein LOC132718984 n=1 Tax=Ruditapes philippinarum TaxID=129788 RepID=UPI00295BC841|nr:uncharacterized protein LOC132718984 [Ruditapes philippinarum]